MLAKKDAETFWLQSQISIATFSGKNYLKRTYFLKITNYLRNFKDSCNGSFVKQLLVLKK